MGLLGGPADRQRQARRPPRPRARVQGHLPALQDDARLPGRAQGRLGHATACRSRSPSSSSSGIENKQEIEEFGIAEFNQRCRESVFEYLEDWNALTERIGFWIDLDDAYRTLDPTYIESVWWALRQIHDKGLLYEGHKVVPYCPGCGTALSSHEVALGYQDVDRPERLRAPARSSRTAGRCRPATSCSCGPRRRGRWSPTPRSPSTPSSSTCAPRPGRSRRPWCSPRRWSSACSAPKACGSSSASRAPRSTACATSRPSPILKSDVYGERGHTVLLGDFVTADDGTGLVHTAIAFGEDDFRLGAAVRTERRQPGAPGRHLRRAHRAVRGAQRQGRRPRPHRGPARAAGGCCAPRRSSTPTRTAGAPATR